MRHGELAADDSSRRLGYRSGFTPRQARPDFRAIVSTSSTSDARNSLSEILVKASAMRNACGSNAIDLVANDERLVSDAPAKNSEIGTSSAVATKCSRLAPTRFLPFSYF